MFCTVCNCEYNGWSGKCPSCKQPLQEGNPPEPPRNVAQTDYDLLVEMIKENGETLEIPLSASQVARSKTTRFPWMGFGYAWTQKMNGAHSGIDVELNTTEVGKDRKWAFPYRGFGFAWQQRIEGLIGGNQLSLQATQMNRKRSWSFPYSGYGYAWTEAMSGKCGQDIRVDYKATQVSQQHRHRFPYFGFGYAWVDKGLLTLTLI